MPPSSNYCPLKFRILNKKNFFNIPRREIGPLGIEASTLVNQKKVNCLGHSKICVLMSFHIFFVYDGIENNFHG